MVKLTPNLIQQSLQYINPVKERELDLRGYKIPEIEHLGATLDQFDTIDLSDNEIRKISGFPLLYRLKCLLMNNNPISKIAVNLEDSLPNLESLILSGCRIEEFFELEGLQKLQELRTLSLLHNPIALKQHYRAYMVWKFPNLRLLDFRKIKTKEREQAKVLFRSNPGLEMVREINRKKLMAQ